MRLFSSEGSDKIQLDDLFQLKNRSGISQLFYNTLGITEIFFFKKKVIYLDLW